MESAWGGLLSHCLKLFFCFHICIDNKELSVGCFPGKARDRYTIASSSQNNSSELPTPFPIYRHSLAPCLRRSSTVSFLPLYFAHHKGVRPSLSLASISAPPAMRIFPTSLWSALAALCRGVPPVLSFALIANIFV